jgi:Fe-Mn family superoxide dismutase
MQRRKFITNLSKAGIAVAAGPAIATNLSFDAATKASLYFQTGFDQTSLSYNYNALEPMIDAQTMEIHYSKHAAAYSTNLKDAVKAENVDPKLSLEEILANISSYSVKMRNNGGGHYNHELFWKSMKPKGEGMPSGKLLEAIEKEFGSFASFKTVFSDAAKNRFGSGWAWLIINDKKKLMVISTPNQDNPLMNVSDIKGFPILCLDVWEHAYYLKYQNKRVDYIENWWKIINWEYIQNRYEKY